MTAPRPGRRRRQPPPITPPPPPPRQLQPAAGHRTPPTWPAIRACYTAHQTDAHHGRIGRGCTTCANYAIAILEARAAQQDPTP